MNIWHTVSVWGYGKLPLDSILAGLEDVYADVRDESGVVFRFSREDWKQHLNSHTFYLAYEGPLPSASPKEVKVDITISERFACPGWTNCIQLVTM
ncbi:MAG: hypothetical protein R6V85_20765 [Polyangia bacterium]